MSIRRCMTFITEGDGDPGIVRDELRSLEARKRDLERALSASREDSSVEVHPNIGELYAKKVGKLPVLLTDDATRPQAMDIIRSLIDRIEVTEGTERGKPDVVLIGALAAILAFTQNNTAALISENGGRVLLVAGACNLRAHQVSSGRRLRHRKTCGLPPTVTPIKRAAISASACAKATGQTMTPDSRNRAR